MNTNEPYGYVIEITHTIKIKSYKYIIPILVEHTFTEPYWNRKIYKTIKIAEEALNNIKKTDFPAESSNTYKYKIISLYRKEEI